MLGLAFLLSAHAARIVVDADGSGDHATIQDALDAASRGDHVVVLPGTYDAVQVTGTSVPILGLEGPDATWIETSDYWAIYHSSSSPLRVEGLSLSASNSGIYSSGGEVHARRVRAYDALYGFYGYYGGAWLLEAVVAAGNSSYGAYAYRTDFVLEHATFVSNGSHLNSRYDSLTADQVVGYDGTPVYSCTSGTLDVSYALFGEVTGSWPSCATSDHVLLGFDVEFVDHSGDWASDDLREVGLAVDAGPSDCEDVDGTVCDLGAFGGPWGSDSDADGDGLPDAWEEEQGLDPTVDDGGDDDDGDGLENLGEYLYGTDLADADSDGDGAEDLVELQAGFDPNDPDDQAPTALVSGADWGYVGDVSLLDGSASYDPLGEALSYRWTATQQPSRSTLDPELGSDSTLAFVPDAAGRWTVQLEVDDGDNTATAALDIAVYEGREVRIPEDFESLDEIQLQPGMVVIFGEGEHELGQRSFAQETTLRGAGSGLTTLQAQRLTVTGSDTVLRLQDLRLEAATSNTPLYVYGARAELASVVVDATDVTQAVLVYLGTLSAVDLEVEARDIAVYNNRGTADLRQTRLVGQRALLSNDGSVHIEGSLLEGTSSGFESSRDQVRLRHLTVRGSQGIRIGGSTAEGDHLYFHEVDNALVCTSGGGPFDFLLTAEAGGIGSGCEVLRHAEDVASPDDEGVPAPDSLAWDGGDWRRLDPDGTVTDVGVTGGPTGLRAEHGLAEPYEDADGDGLVAVSEWALGSSDESPDSDGDGHGDLAELVNGDDPADASDHHPEVEGLAWRGPVGSELEVAPTWGDDPDGDDCEFSWDDGSVELPRPVDTSAAGLSTLDWTLRCGGGSSTGELLVVVDEELRVPEDVATLAEALLLAEDHHRVLLGAGEHEAEVDLRGRAVALMGQGRETRIVGDVLGDHEALQVQDLSIEGDLRVDGGTLSRLEVIGDLETGSAGGRYVLVHGDLDIVDGASFRNLTVDGDLVANTVGLGAVAVTGTLRRNNDAILSYVVAGGSLGLEPFILHEGDPDTDILEPWPGSPLWDAASSAVEDPDGSIEDIGATGGPGAWETDADLDGLNDRWEALHGVDDPEEDSDLDGLDNLAEFEQLTDPSNPDTDGDRIPDGADQDPRTANGDGLALRLEIDDRHPWPGQPVTLSAAGSHDPLGSELAFSWTVSGPPGSEELLLEGPTVHLVADGVGTWEVRLDAWTSDGLELVATDVFHTRRAVEVASGAVLQEAIDEALPGTMLVLQEGSWTENLVIDKPLVLSHAEGARGGVVEGSVEGAAITVLGGHLLLEDLSVRGADGTSTVVLQGGDLQLRRARLMAGETSLSIGDGEVDAVNSVLIGASQILNAYQARVSFRHCVLGYPEDEEVVGAPFSMADTHLVVEHSAFVWTAPHINAVSCSFRCTAEFAETIVPDPAFLQVGGVVTERDVLDVDPGFLLEPHEASRLGLSDFRLSGDSPARDAATASVDPDGSVGDLGVHGGRWGDWPDVDEDRDGYTNLENDCDDTDREVVPDVWTGTCPSAQGCSGCATGSTRGGWLLVGALLLTCRRRRG